MEGYSGQLTRHFYNNLLSYEGAKYLEVGTWKGSSLCAAIYGNNTDTICIDNWSEFGGPKAEFLDNLSKYKGENTVHVIEQDCFEADLSAFPRRNIFLYDGSHEEESHYKALIHFLPFMEDIFIYVVDDWNWECVRNGTERSIRDSGVQVLYEREIRLTWDNEHTPWNQAKETWWNGIYITLLSKP